MVSIALCSAALILLRREDSGTLVVVDMPCPELEGWDFPGRGEMSIFCQVHRKYWLGFQAWWSRHRGDRPSLSGAPFEREREIFVATPVMFRCCSHCCVVAHCCCHCVPAPPPSHQADRRPRAFGAPLRAGQGGAPHCVGGTGRPEGQLRQPGEHTSSCSGRHPAGHFLPDAP